jgi:hypothetical protein
MTGLPPNPPPVPLVQANYIVYGHPILHRLDKRRHPFIPSVPANLLEGLNRHLLFCEWTPLSFMKKYILMIWIKKSVLALV